MLYDVMDDDEEEVHTVPNVLTARRCVAMTTCVCAAGVCAGGAERAAGPGPAAALQRPLLHTGILQ